MASSTNHSRLWRLLRTLIVVGVVVMFVGPCAKMTFHDPGIGAEDDLYRWLGYASLLVGAAIAVGAAVGIFLIDRKTPRG
jgi:hypothetical protein